MNDEFTLEKLKIVEGLAEVKNTVNILVVETKLHNENYDKNIATMQKNIELLNVFANGNDQITGARIRFDRLEKFTENQKKHYFTFYAAIVSVMAATIWEFVRNGFNAHK